MIGTINKEVAECVGLWLAEGSTTSKSEVTFTNNCLELIDLFYKTTDNLFKKNYNYKERIYVYNSDGSKVKLPYRCQINYYIHKRATKPYLIFRIASVNLVKEWKNIVSETLNNEELYPFILRGFFAGEGNIHTGKKGVRVIRIFQKTRKDFIDKILNNFKIKHVFKEDYMAYIISNKSNWDIFARLKLADLHPNKKEKFWKVYNNFKEDHYDKKFLFNNIPSLLDNPLTSKEVSTIIKRSPARISEVLVELKKQGKVKNFRVKSKDYWVNNDNMIIISEVKDKYLCLLEKEALTSDLARDLNVTWKSAHKRLNELEKLNLVKKTEEGKWMKIPNQKEIIII